LCGDCRHAERIVSAHGSVFSLCRRSFTDPAFPKYPPIPVVACGGYEADRPASINTHLGGGVGRDPFR
jgi:hypothetical protein